MSRTDAFLLRLNGRFFCPFFFSGVLGRNVGGLVLQGKANNGKEKEK